jgi:hypothetical protein
MFDLGPCPPPAGLIGVDMARPYLKHPFAPVLRLIPEFAQAREPALDLARKVHAAGRMESCVLLIFA